MARILVLGRAARRPLFVISLSYLALLVLACVLAPIIAPYNPNAQNYSAVYGRPTSSNWLGTDNLGRDLLSRLLYGGRISLLGVLEAVVVFLAVGLTFGILSGYFKGVIDGAVVWASEVLLAVPQLVIILGVLAIFTDQQTAAMVVLGFIAGPALGLVVRGAVQSVCEECYITAAKASGLRSGLIIWRHVLPRITGTVIVQVTLFAGGALVFQTGLDFLGIGTQPPTASWGSMVATASQSLSEDPWMLVPSGLITSLTILAFGLVGDGVRDAWGDRTRDGRRASAGRRTAHVRKAARADRRQPASAPVGDGAVLRVSGLTVALTAQDESLTIVDDIDLVVTMGECLGIVGESGCGKSVTALAIIGLLPESLRISNGTVTSPDEAPRKRHLPRRRRDAPRAGISMIFQEPVASLDPSFSVGHQLAEVVRIHDGIGRRQARARALTLLADVRIDDPEAVMGRFPHQLSGGMAQRVAIAAALACRPKVLIADEPTTALDVTVQKEILSLLAKLRLETGLAVILVSHDWGVIANSCQSAVVMYAGQVVERGPVEQLFLAPRHPYTRRLMESNPHFAASPKTALPYIPGRVPGVGQRASGCRFADRCSERLDACVERDIDLEMIASNRSVRCVRHAEHVLAGAEVPP